MAIKIKGGTFSGNGVAVSIPRDGVDLDIEDVEINNNGKGIEVRDDISQLFDLLKQEIWNSGMDDSIKERLLSQIINLINSKKIEEVEKSAIISSLRYAGDKALDIFGQIIAVKIATLII